MTTTATEPRVLDDQELARLNGALRDSHLMLNHRLGRLTALFGQSQPTDMEKVHQLQGIFEDLVTASRSGLEVAEQLADHQRAVDAEDQGRAAA